MTLFSPQVRKRVACVLMAGALPASPVVLITTGSGRATLASALLIPVAAVIWGPTVWPGGGRFGGLLLVMPAAITLVGPGFFALFVAFFTLCSSDGDRTYLSSLGGAVALCSFLVPYAAGAAWAVARPGRAARVWPIVILVSIGIGIAVLAFVEGGPHHCET
jgi:hypothetical protein